jgi:serine/threonine protein phosphatase 1
MFYRKQSAARVGDGIRLYAIGDVHGCSVVLQRLLALIDVHLASYPSQRPILVFLGDYVDRGLGSRHVIDQLIALRESRETVFLKGNHESCMLEFLSEPAILAKWMQFGALDTLKSYGLTPGDYMDRNEQESLAAGLRAVLEERGHLDFLERLRTSFVCDDFFFVHAGVRPGIPLDRQCEEDLLWIRDEFLQYPGDFEKIVVHGHTPVPQPEVCSNRINIDTGAYATGRLTCLMIERDKMKFISAS